MKIALVDLGSNTIRLSVYGLAGDGGFSLLFSQKSMAGLVNYISDKTMSAEGFEKACRVILDFRDILNQFGIDNMNIFATASLRNITNSDEAIRYIKERTGETVSIISGHEEAELGYYGSMLSVKAESGVMFDIGGGSTEIAEYSGGKIQSAESYEIGSLSLFNGFVKEIWPTRDEEKNIKLQAKVALANVLPIKNAGCICAVGGTNRALLALSNAYFKKSADNREISRNEFKKLKKEILKKDNTAKKLILKSCPDRIHTIIPGMLIVDEIMKKFGADAVTVSKYGVREGYLCKRIM